MIFIKLSNLLDSIDHSLEKNIKSYNNSFINDFIDELKNHLKTLEVKRELEKLPPDTLFTLDRYEGNFAVCENHTNGKMYDIPRILVNPYAKDGTLLKFDGEIYQISNHDNTN